MATVVVKLGSSIVADDDGEVRREVLDALCEEVAARREAGDEVVIVTSGAIAHGMRLMGLPQRPTAMQGLQAASAVGQGKLYREYDQLLQAQGVRSAQVLLTFFDMSARTHYLNARHTLRTLLDWDVVPVINENDTTTTDEISFGDNDFLAAQVAILLGADLLVLLTDLGGLFSADPRERPDAELIADVRQLEELERYDIGLSTSPLGSGGMRSKVVAAEMATAAGIPVTITSGSERELMARGLAGERSGHALPPAGGPGLELQALAQVRQADPRTADDRRRRRAGAARARHEPAAGRDRGRRRRVRGRRRRRGARRRPRGRQGDRQLLRRGAAADQGAADRRRCASCCRAPPRKRCTGTTSSWNESPCGHPARSSDGEAAIRAA